MNPSNHFICVASILLGAACSAPDVPNPMDAGPIDAGASTGSDGGTPGPDSTVPDANVPDSDAGGDAGDAAKVDDAGDAAKVEDAGDSGPTCVINGTTYANGAPAPSDVCASCVTATSTSLWTTMACGTGLVCEDYAGPVCADPNWDEWPIPNSQAEVTAGAPNLENYTDNGDGTVTDKITGLMWQQSTPTTRYSLATASSYCSSLTLGNHGDWRVPSVVELFSIVDFGVNSAGLNLPAINATYFPSTPFDAETLTSRVTKEPTSAGPNVWVINFSGGVIDGTSYGPSGAQFHVRCVR